MIRFASEAGPALPLLIGALVVAALISFALTPAVRTWVSRLGMVDRPDPRRVNTQPIPRGGGFAVAAAFVPVVLLALLVNGMAKEPFVGQPDAIGPEQLLGLLVGGVLAVGLGFLDDYLQLRARWQLLSQVLLAVLAMALGLTITTLTDPFGTGSIQLNGAISLAFTLFWIVGMINSINWIDGLDGLSSGVSLVAAITLGGISLTASIDQPFVALFCFALAGALLGFLRWNFHPASIFVGTSGVMFVGYTLAVLSILGTAKVAVALLVLGVPILDTFWIIVRRVASGRSPFSPDRGHIHHRLLDLGISHRQAVMLIYAICAALGALSFVLSGRGQVYAFLGIAVASGIALLLLTRRTWVPEELTPEPYEEFPPLGPMPGRRRRPGPDGLGTGGTTEAVAFPPISGTGGPGSESVNGQLEDPAVASRPGPAAEAAARLGAQNRPEPASTGSRPAD